MQKGSSVTKGKVRRRVTKIFRKGSFHDHDETVPDETVNKDPRIKKFLAVPLKASQFLETCCKIILCESAST
jgi:hypothetical protein